MSTEPTPTPGGETPSPDERPLLRRRRQLSVVAVAAAVLLAGGGGAYWASTAADGTDSGGAGGTSEPPPLALDGSRAGPAEGSPADIAPGEPTSARTYRATGGLPKGPRSAAVYRTKATVPRTEVAALAKTLSVPGAPEKKDGRWLVGDGAGRAHGPSLTVNDDRSAGNWTYQRQNPAGGTPCPTPPPGLRDHSTSNDGSAQSGSAHSRTICPQVADSGKGAPVTEQKAKRAVRPALRTLKMSDATLDATVTLGSLRMVTAAPTVAGMPTQDWNSTFTVGPDGSMVRGHGTLGELTKGSSYPVMTAGETLKHLNKQGATGSAGTSSSVREPAPDGTGTPGTPSTPDDQRKPVPVKGADFGLVTHYSAGRPVLVPSWIYTVALPGGGRTAQVAYPAVQPKFLKPPRKGRPGSGSGSTGQQGSPPLQAVNSYTAHGRTLKLTFWGGVCGGYTASADEAGASGPVKVTVRPKHTDAKKVCVKIAKRQTVEVTLDKALGGRKVVDAQDGKAVTRAR